MDIQKLKYFVSVAKHLNFTKAANEFNIAQTAMSRQIANLENELGFVLFYRDNRFVELSPAGREFYWEAVFLLDHYEKAVIRAQNAACGIASSIKIGIGSYERALIQPMIKQYSAEYPQIKISCEQYTYLELTDMLNQGLIDILFGINKYIAGEDIKTITISTGLWGVVVSNDHPLATHAHVTSDELKDETQITMNEGSYDQIKRSNSTSGIFFHDYIQVNSLEAKLLMVEAGLGVAYVPKIIESMLSDRTTLLDLEFKFSPRNFVAAYLSTNNNPAVELLLDIVKSYEC